LTEIKIIQVQSLVTQVRQQMKVNKLKSKDIEINKLITLIWLETSKYLKARMILLLVLLKMALNFKVKFFK